MSNHLCAEFPNDISNEPQEHCMLIEANRKHKLDFEELWHFRELLYYLAWRDIKVRYKQATLGILWAVLQPLLTVITFWIFFGRLAKIPSDGIPYPLFSLTAMLPWGYFTGAVSRGSTSLVSSGSLFSKIYFPRMIIPISAVFSGLVDYTISFVLLMVMILLYGMIPSFNMIATMISLTTLTVLLAMGVSLWLSAINVKYRDVGHILPFLIQLWLFATPIVYPLSLVPDKFRWLAIINPMSGIIEGFRSSLMSKPLDFHSLSISLFFAILMVVTGMKYFTKVERRFADIV